MRIKPALLLVLLLWASLATRALADATPPRLDFTEVKSADHVDVRLRNLTTADLTVTIDFDEQMNVELSPSCPLTHVLRPGAEEVVVRVYKPRDNRRWKYHWKYHYRFGDCNARHDDAAVYRLPFASGKSYRVLQGMGGTFSHQGEEYNAIDFQMDEGTEILAARDGRVVHVVDRYTDGGRDPSFKGKGNEVLVRHADGTYASYLHLRQGGAAVHPGDRVKAGDRIGWSGNTGYSTRPHLHFMVFRPIDGYKTESFPVRFRVDGQSEPVELQQGETYTEP